MSHLASCGMFKSSTVPHEPSQSGRRRTSDSPAFMMYSHVPATLSSRSIRVTFLSGWRTEYPADPANGSMISSCTGAGYLSAALYFPPKYVKNGFNPLPLPLTTHSFLSSQHSHHSAASGMDDPR